MTHLEISYDPILAAQPILMTILKTILNGPLVGLDQGIEPLGIMKMMMFVEVSPSYFDGNWDPKAFLDWATSVDQYFDWSNMLETLRVNFTQACLLFLGLAKLHRLNVECQQE